MLRFCSPVDTKIRGEQLHGCLLTYLHAHSNKSNSSANPTPPPTAPPTIAPIWDEWCAPESGLVVVGAAVNVEVTSVVVTDPPDGVVVEENEVVEAEELVVVVVEELEQLVEKSVAVGTVEVRVTVTATGTCTTLSASPIERIHEHCEQHLKL